MEELLYLLHTIFCQVDVLFLLIYDKVSGFLDLFSHDGVDLRELSAGFTFFHLSCKNVTCFIKLRWLAALSGNDQWCTCFIDQYRVDLIDNSKLHTALYQLFLVNDHVISQIIKSEFVICYVSNVAVISSTTFFFVHTVQYYANCQSQKFMYLSHPLWVTLCQIVIDRNDMYTFSCQCIQICRKGRYQCLTFTSFHLSDTSLMKNDTAD